MPYTPQQRFPKIAPSNGGSSSHLTDGSLGPRVSHQMASQLIQPFMHSTSVCPTNKDTQTMLRATSVAIGHIYHHHHDYRSYRCSLHFSLALDTFRKDDHPEVSRDSYSLALVTVWIHNYAAANHRMT